MMILVVRKFPKRLAALASFLMLLSAQGMAAAPDRGALSRSVGSGAGCDFNDLQTAIDNVTVNEVLRLSGGIDHSGRSHSIQSGTASFTIRGGHDNCSDFTSGTARTIIDVADNDGAVFDILYQGQPTSRQVVLENISIRNSAGANAGGVRVRGVIGELSVALRNVEIIDHERTGGASANGAGLRVQTLANAVAAAPMVSLDNATIVANNVAEGDGGGIYCQSSYLNFGTSALKIGKTPVLGNTAAVSRSGAAVTSSSIPAARPFCSFQRGASS